MARYVLPTDLHDVAEARRGDQRGARGLALEDQVGGNSGTVQHAADIVRLRMRLGQREHHASQERLRRVARGAWRLGAPQASGRCL